MCAHIVGVFTTVACTEVVSIGAVSIGAVSIEEASTGEGPWWSAGPTTVGFGTAPGVAIGADDGGLTGSAHAGAQARSVTCGFADDACNRQVIRWSNNPTAKASIPLRDAWRRATAMVIVRGRRSFTPARISPRLRLARGAARCRWSLRNADARESRRARNGLGPPASPFRRSSLRARSRFAAPAYGIGARPIAPRDGRAIARSAHAGRGREGR